MDARSARALVYPHVQSNASRKDTEFVLLALAV